MKVAASHIFCDPKVPLRSQIHRIDKPNRKFPS